MLIAAGWSAIGLGWWNASRIDVETGQLPYLVSGGFGGLGLLVLGAAGILVDVVQVSLWRGRVQTEALRVTIESLASAQERVEDRAAASGPDDDDVADAVAADAAAELAAELADELADELAGRREDRAPRAKRRRGRSR